MKKVKIVKGVAIILYMMLRMPLNAQEIIPAAVSVGHYHAADTTCKKNMAKAQAYLRGYLVPCDTLKAFELFMQCAQAGVPKAMNALGILYSIGNGIGADYSEAVNWFEKAGQLGYAQAWLNLGEIYKFGHGVPQDFYKAYDCFKKAADFNYSGGWYAQGYMLSKGLGCRQDYYQAYDLFKKGVEQNSSACMFMLGLCLRNGFGVTRDTAAAMVWLKRSAAQGYRYAPAELSSANPLYVPATMQLKSKKVNGTSTPDGMDLQNVPQTLKKVKHNLHGSNISGEYIGYLITYDWSGQNVISKSMLKLRLTTDRKLVTGQWAEADTLNATINGTMTDTSVCFTNAIYRRPEHFNPVRPLRWQFKTASLEIVKSDTNTYLAGNLQFYLPEMMEPSMPMYITLAKTGKSSCACGANCTCGINCKCIEGNNCCKPVVKSQAVEADDKAGINDVTVFPNPFGHVLNLSFTLQNSSEVKAAVFTMGGNLVKQSSLGILPAGKHMVPLEADLPNGSYVVKVTIGTQVSTTIVVKQ